MSVPKVQTIEVFLSFAVDDQAPLADDDRAAAQDLCHNLGKALGTHGEFNWNLWGFDKQLLVGEDFDRTIQSAIAAADLGLFALSPAFLNSPYIRDKELPAFMAPASGKRIAPIQLKNLPRTTDLRGLDQRQIFGFGYPYWSGHRPYKREEWANSLADELYRLAVRYNLGR